MSQRNLVNHWLIHQAARRAPVSLSERLEEEWRADLDARKTGFSRLRFGLGCCWATRVIKSEPQPAMPAVSGVAAAPKLIFAPMPGNFGRFSSRSSTFFLVLTLHVTAFYVVFTRLSQTHKPAAPTVMQNIPVDSPRVPQPPIEVPVPKIENNSIDVFKPDVAIPRDPDATHDVTTDLALDRAPPITPLLLGEPAHAARQVMGGAGAGFPNPDDYYPSQARYLGEQGVATVQVCVTAIGRLAAEPTLSTGAGSPRLDEAALKLARAGSGHYRATTEDGRAVDSCYPLRIRFQIRN
jgi:TonB family protein